MRVCRLVVVLLLGASVVFPVHAMTKDDAINGDAIRETVETVASIIKENYVFPDVGNEISNSIVDKLERGEYRSVKSYGEFARVLTRDVQFFNGDKHLRVLFEPEKIRSMKLVDEEAREKRRVARIDKLRKDNYGFKEVRILDGNIAYLNLTDLADPALAGDTVAAAMKLIENSDAILIDLRENGGGPPSMVQLLVSYFIGPEPVHINSFYKRQQNITKQFWTLPHVPGKRMTDTPIFLLTSGKTFSAAEELCYDLQQLKRAVIVGEATAGGAHPGGRIKATDYYNVWTPTARAINPISNSNWEGVGVQPDIEAPADRAFNVAYQAALDLLDGTGTRMLSFTGKHLVP
jgi:C-terminal processing protease CtpA/Prc